MISIVEKRQDLYPIVKLFYLVIIFQSIFASFMQFEEMKNLVKSFEKGGEMKLEDVSRVWGSIFEDINKFNQFIEYLWATSHEPMNQILGISSRLDEIDLKIEAFDRVISITGLLFIVHTIFSNTMNYAADYLVLTGIYDIVRAAIFILFLSFLIFFLTLISYIFKAIRFHRELKLIEEDFEELKKEIISMLETNELT